MDTFTALAEPNRRRLLASLVDGAKPVNQLVERLGLSQPVISKHLRALRDAELVRVEPRGQQRLYSINPAPLAELDDWLAPYRQFWSQRLDALEDYLDKTHSENNDDH